jgi:hypothetical protein
MKTKIRKRSGKQLFSQIGKFQSDEISKEQKRKRMDKRRRRERESLRQTKEPVWRKDDVVKFGIGRIDTTKKETKDGITNNPPEHNPVREGTTDDTIRGSERNEGMVSEGRE